MGKFLFILTSILVFFILVIGIILLISNLVIATEVVDIVLTILGIVGCVALLIFMFFMLYMIFFKRKKK